MVILSILEVVIILLLIFLRKRILIAIALIKEASRWVAGFPPGLGWLVLGLLRSSCLCLISSPGLWAT